jgi:SAM-dependent methyltransferase
MKNLFKSLIPQNTRNRLIDAYAKYKYALLRFHCPICNGRFSYLHPAGYYVPVLKEKKVIGAGYRIHAVCPGCGSGDRERLLFLYLKKHTRIFDDSLKVLHVAPEKNLQRILKGLSHIDYLSGDIQSEEAMVKMDITEIAYPDNSFDVIICNHVLEHIPDDGKAMAELKRIMTPGGWGIFQVPISPVLNKTIEDPTVVSPEDRERIFGQDDHVRIYGRDYTARLARAGFRVETYDPRADLGLFGVFKYALCPGEHVFVCRKHS